MNFKRARITTPKSKAFELFEHDIIEGSLTELGDFELIPGSEIELQTLYEVIKVSTETPHLTLDNGHMRYIAWGEEDETRISEREKRLANMEDQLIAPKSVAINVTNPDHHAKWKRIINDLTRIVKTMEPIQCVQTVEGPVLEAHVISLWKDEVVMLVENHDIAVCNIFIKNGKLTLQFKLL